ncbi:MAG: hypothetical protein PVG99_09230 [Desulfobacteraceae bacterium]|jgi:hypothetical protein
MIYIGNFIHTTNQEQKDEGSRRHGEFSMIVETDKAEVAIQMFKKRLVEYRETSDFFEGRCSIFFTQLLEFESFPKRRAIMLNYISYAGDPMMPFIGCSIPSEETNGCRIYDWKDKEPEVDGQKERAFLEFEV